MIRKPVLVIAWCGRIATLLAQLELEGEQLGQEHRPLGGIAIDQQWLDPGTLARPPGPFEAFARTIDPAGRPERVRPI